MSQTNEGTGIMRAFEAMREALPGVLDDADQFGGNRRSVTRYEIDRGRAALALADKVKPCSLCGEKARPAELRKSQIRKKVKP